MNTTHGSIWHHSFLASYFEVKVEQIDWNFAFAREVLEYTSQEGLCEVESGQPEHNGRSRINPFLQRKRSKDDNTIEFQFRIGAYSSSNQSILMLLLTCRNVRRANRSVT